MGSAKPLNPPERQNCARCGGFLASNTRSRTTGLYSPRQSAELRAQIEAFIAGVAADLGGESELTTLQRSYVEKLGQVEATIRLLIDDITKRGLLTQAGRPREVYDKLLTALAAFDRLAQRIGLERRAKQVPSLAEFIANRL